MKKEILEKVKSVIEKLKGKKPLVIIVSVVIIALAYFAAQKGYISEELINVDVIVSHVGDLFSDEKVQPVVDSFVNVVDTLAVSDSLSIK